MKTRTLIGILIFLSCSVSMAEGESSQPAGDTRGWTILAKYNHVINIHNSYDSGSGERYSSSTSSRYGFLGLGASYSYKFSANWSVFPELSVLQYLHTDPKIGDDATLAVASLNIGRVLGPGQIFGGISTQRFLQNSDLKYTPSIGFRVGYEWYCGQNSSINFGFDFWTFRSENLAGSVNDQQSELQSFLIGYGYRI